MSTRPFLITLAAAGVVLAACGGPTSGTVIGKQYDAPSTYFITSCSLIGKVTVCTPIPEEQPECWEIDLKSGDDTGSVCVDQKTFSAAIVGQHYP